MSSHLKALSRALNGSITKVVGEVCTAVGLPPNFLRFRNSFRPDKGEEDIYAHGWLPEFFNMNTVMLVAAMLVCLPFCADFLNVWAPKKIGRIADGTASILLVSVCVFLNVSSMYLLHSTFLQYNYEVQGWSYIPQVLASWVVSIAHFYALYASCTAKPNLRKLKDEAKTIQMDRLAASTEQQSEEEVEQEKRFCKICEIYRAESTKHCKVCNVCVPMLDHHCPFVSNCVGLHNRKSFLIFLFCNFLFAVLSLTISFHCHMACVVNVKGYSIDVGSPGYEALRRSCIRAGKSASMAVYAIILLLVFSMFFAWQSFLYMTNQTTNDWVARFRKGWFYQVQQNIVDQMSHYLVSIPFIRRQIEWTQQNPILQKMHATVTRRIIVKED